MTLDEMRAAKRKLKLTNETLAEKAGLPVSTVSKILSGVTRQPHGFTLKALEEVLKAGSSGEEKRGGMTDSAPTSGRENGTLFLQEPSYQYGTSAERQPEKALQKPLPEDVDAETTGESGKRYTLDDYLKLPPERRVELIDGRFYDLASPTGVHQRIVMKLWKQLDSCIEEHHMVCIAQASPFDVLLDSDVYTVVEPDVMVFCQDPRQALKVRAEKAPEFVCEVLSPSTAFRDRHLKLFKYRAAGVREVWLIDPEKRIVEVYDFAAGEDLPALYSFQDAVPVRMSEGKCEVDFALIGKDLDAWA